MYKHPLFHRDKPHDLHLLRRRTCPGVDGRKVRPETELRTIATAFRSPTMVSPEPTDETSDSDDTNKEVEKKKRKSGSDNSKSDVSLLNENGILRSLDQENEFDVSKKQRVETIHPESLDTTEKYMRGPNRLVSPIATACPADLKEQSLLVSKVSRQLDEHAKRAALTGKKCAKKRIGSVSSVTPMYVSDTMKYHALTYDDEIEIFDSARGCVVERSSSKRDICTEDVSDDESENNATVISFNDNEVSVDTTKHIISAPVQDANVINRVVSKLLSSNDNSNSFVAIAAFCMRTNPNDPSLGEKAIQLMSNHADLAHEFCRYKIALSPNNNHAEFMKEMFRGESEDTIRGFKTFVLNSLNDLVRQSESAAWNEFHDLTNCYNTWFSGVTASA